MGCALMHDEGGRGGVCFGIFSRSSSLPPEHVLWAKSSRWLQRPRNNAATMPHHTGCGFSAGVKRGSFQHRFTIVSPSFQHRFTIVSLFGVVSTSLHHRFTIASTSFHHRCVVGIFHLHPQVSKSAWGETRTVGRSQPGLQKTAGGQESCSWLGERRERL